MNRKLPFLLLLCAIVFLKQSSAQTYCAATYITGCNSGDPVVSFSTTGGTTNITNNNSGCTSLNGNGYSVFSGTGYTHTASPGDVVNFSFVVGNSFFDEAVYIWVDWNDDGDFIDVGEQVYAQLSPQIQPGVTTTGSFTVPLTAPAVTTRLRIRCSDFGPASFSSCSSESYGETEDYAFTVQSLVPCSGQPSITAASTASTVCANTAFTLSTVGAVGIGYTFQWQSSLGCANTFTNIPSATNANYLASAGITANTQYRVIVNCTNSGLADTSNIISMTVSCYCTSSAPSGAGADIGRIKISDASYSYANPVNMPGQLINNSSANNGYTDFTGLPPIMLTPGGVYRDSVTRINAASVSTQYLMGWIDYNQDGIFGNTELIINTGGNSLAVANSHYGTFTVPATATPGITRMRHVMGVFGSVSSCGNYSSGETEDYTVFIVPPAPQASNNGPACAGQPIQLTATPNITCATYNWTGPGGYTSTLQNPVLGNPASGLYCVTYTYNGTTFGPACTTVQTGQTSNDTIQVPICSGQNVVINGVPVTVAGYYPTIYTNVGGCDSIITTQVIVNPAPAAPGVISPVNYCHNATASALTASGINLKWYDAPTGGNQYPTAPTPLTTLLGQTTYYVSQTTANTCESPRVAIVVNVYAVPVITGTSSTNPTSCGGTQGSITLSGLTAGNAYTLDYTKNTIAQPSVSVTANASGNVVLSNLGAGNYASITVAANGCTSQPAGPVTLTDPSTPVITANNNGPLCAGSALNLTVTTVANATYSWTGPSYTSAVQNPTIASSTVANSGTYTVTATLNGCSSIPATTTVVVNPVPAITTSSNSPVCSGNTLDLTSTFVANGVYSWTGPNSFVSASQNPTISPANVIDGGTYTLSVTAAGCVSNVSTLTVVVNPTPTAPATSNLQYCQYATVSALTTTGTTGTLKWYDAPVAGNQYPTTPTPSTTTPGTTVYYVSQTITGCESARTPLSVEVIAKPLPPTVITPVLLCQNQITIPLTANGQNLLWYMQATGGTAIANDTPSTTTAGSTTHYVSQTINGCESDRAFIVVTVAPAPAAPPVQSPVIYCHNEIVSNPLDSFVTGAGLVWYTQASGGTVLPNTPVVNTNTPDTVTYYVAQQFGVCESARAALTIEVRARPLSPTGNALAYCQFENAPPLTANGQNLLWYQQLSGGPAGTQAAPVPATNIAGTFTYYVSQTVNGCEGARGTVTVLVKPQPVMPVANPSQYAYCQNDQAVTLTGTGSDLLWYDVATGGIGSTAAPTPATNVPGTYYYYVTQTIDGCESERLPIQVIIYPTPSAPGVVSPFLMCEGDVAAPLTATGQNLKWFAEFNALSTLSSAPIPPTDTVATFSYFVSQTVNGCESPRAEIIVQVNPRVFANVAVSSDLFCQYDTISVLNDTSNVSTATYTWNFDGGTSIAGANAGPYQVSWMDYGNKMITVIVNNLNCSDTDSKAVTVKESPRAEFSIQTDACLDNVVNVQATFANAYADDFAWTFHNAEVLNGKGPGYYKLKWNTAGDKYISLQTTLNECRSQVFYDTITVHDYPRAKIVSVSNNDVCSRDSVLLIAEDLGDSYTYQWSPERFITNDGLRNVYARPQNAGNIYLQVSDQYGCSGKDSVFINTKPCCTVTLPTAFSPNGDGRNEKFHIITPGNHELYTFRIVNRWGQTVFESLNQSEGWDGTFQGEPQPIGTYNYFVQLRCDEGDIIEKKGEVVLIR